MIIRSAVLSASRPGMLSVRLGLIVPSLSMANSTVQLKPWCLARILASCGRASSERYSSSPLTRTTCLPLPGPSPPLIASQGSAATGGGGGEQGRESGGREGQGGGCGCDSTSGSAPVALKAACVASASAAILTGRAPGGKVAAAARYGNRPTRPLQRPAPGGTLGPGLTATTHAHPQRGAHDRGNHPQPPPVPHDRRGHAGDPDDPAPLRLRGQRADRHRPHRRARTRGRPTSRRSSSWPRPPPSATSTATCSPRPRRSSRQAE